MDGKNYEQPDSQLGRSTQHTAIMPIGFQEKKVSKTT